MDRLHLRKPEAWANKIAQPVEALAAKPEDPSVIPGTPMAEG